jgi:nucleoside phosphorylase
MSVDVLLYVALGEEFHDVMDVLGEGFEHNEPADVTLSYFTGAIHSPVQQRDISVVVVPAFKMGNSRSGAAASWAIARFDPQNVVVIGIAGSLVADLNPGDIFIPDSVNEYMANTAAVGDGEDGWTLDTSGNRFTTSGRLLGRFALFRLTQKSYFAEWTRAVTANADALIAPELREALAAHDISLPPVGKILAGDDRTLASGPTVGKGVEFGRWVRKRIDRKIAAMEMESAGVYDAAHLRPKGLRAIAIRGISDFADERKDIVEKIAGNRVRILAVKNAASLFIASIRAGLFKEEEPDQPTPPPSGNGPRTKLFEIKLVQVRDDQGKYVGEGLANGELAAATLAQQILNARNVGYTPAFAIGYEERDAILAAKTRLEAMEAPDLSQQNDLAHFEHRLHELDYMASMIRRRLEILFCPEMMRQVPNLAHQYAQRILGVLELMNTRSGWSDSSYDVAVWHVQHRQRMAGPIGQEIWNTDGFRAYLARGGGHGDFALNVYSNLRDRRCFPLIVDLIAQTSFVPPSDREFGHYGPLPKDEDLFDLSNWRVQIEG